jgi:hypothetical protein
MTDPTRPPVETLDRLWRDEAGVWERYHQSRKSTHPFQPHPEKPRECVHCGRREEAHQ